MIEREEFQVKALSDSTHELKLVTHNYTEHNSEWNNSDFCYLQPYCPCGWVGTIVDLALPEMVSDQYKEHVNGPPIEKGESIVL